MADVRLFSLHIGRSYEKEVGPLSQKIGEFVSIFTQESVSVKGLSAESCHVEIDLTCISVVFKGHQIFQE